MTLSDQTSVTNLRAAPDPERPSPGGRISAFAESLVLHRGRWTVGALVLLGVALFLGSRLTFRSEARDFLPRGTPAPDPTLQGLGEGDRILVVLESDRPLTTAEIGPSLDTLAARLNGLPGVRRLEHRVPTAFREYLTNEFPRHLLLYFSPTELDSLGDRLSLQYIERALLKIGDSIPRTRLAVAMGVERTDPLGVIDPALRKLRELGGSMQIKLVDGYFAVPDHRSFFLSIEPAAQLTTIDSARVMVRAIDSIISTVKQLPALRATLADKHLFAIGRPVALVNGVDVAVSDVKRVALAAVVVVLGMLMLFLRRVAAPMLIVGTVLYGLALTAAVSSLVFGALNLVSWVFIAALVGFGDEFALYVVSHYWLATPPGTTRAQALAAAIRRPGPGILLGGVTSAGAFFSLILISYPIMSQVAWVSTVGLVLILACSFTILPLALTYTSPGQGAATSWYRWTAGANRLGRSRPHFWLVAWAVLLGGSLLLVPRLTWDAHPWKLAVRGIPASAELERMSQRVGASLTPLLMVSRGTTAEAALEADRAAVKELDGIKHIAGVAAVVSLSRWVPSPAAQAASLEYLQRHEEVFSASRFRRDFLSAISRMAAPDTLLTRRYLPTVARHLEFSAEPMTVEQLRPAGLGDFIDRHLVLRGGEYLAISDIYLTRIPWAPGAVDQFTTAMHDSGGAGLASAEFAGTALRGATRESVLQRDFLLVSALAILFTLGVLVARFRRADLVALCLVPVVCGITAMLGMMALLGMEMNMLTIAAGPLILGLGSDDGIHIVDRLARREALSDVLNDTAPPMTITTLTTIAAFACTGLANFPGVREFGLVAAWGLLVCLVASLQLVPMGYRFMRR